MKIKDRFTTLPPDLDIRITSDTHFWHGNIIRYSNRWPFIPEEQREQFRATRQADPPFTITTEIVEAMNAELLRQINQDITPITWVISPMGVRAAPWRPGRPLETKSSVMTYISCWATTIKTSQNSEVSSNRSLSDCF